MKAHLTPGGAFAFEAFNPNLSLLTRDRDRRYPVGSYLDPDGRGRVTVTESNVYDAASQINHIQWFYRIASQTEETTATLDLRMYFPQEIEAVLSRQFWITMVSMCVPDMAITMKHSLPANHHAN